MGNRCLHRDHGLLLCQWRPSPTALQRRQLLTWSRSWSATLRSSSTCSTTSLRRFSALRTSLPERMRSLERDVKETIRRGAHAGFCPLSLVLFLEWPLPSFPPPSGSHSLLRSDMAPRVPTPGHLVLDLCQDAQCSWKCLHVCTHSPYPQCVPLVLLSGNRLTDCQSPGQIWGIILVPSLLALCPACPIAP